jgi:Cys-rich protein (TIGR01571 family)
MHRAIFPDTVAASLEDEFDEEDPRTTATADQLAGGSEYEPTIVRAFTETFPREDDIESPNPVRNQLGDNESPPVNTTTATSFANSINTSASISHPNSRIEESSSLPIFSRPNIVAVTAIPAGELGHLVGFESTPYGHWRTPIHQFFCQFYPTCLCSSLLPFLVIAQLNHKLREASFFSTLLYFLFGFTCLVVGVFLFHSPYVLLITVMPIIFYAFHLRQLVRKQFKIPGSDQMDCLLSFCFPACVIAQV